MREQSQNFDRDANWFKLPGMKGNRYDNFYEIAKKNGFDGDLQDWYKYLGLSDFDPSYNPTGGGEYFAVYSESTYQAVKEHIETNKWVCVRHKFETDTKTITAVCSNPWECDDVITFQTQMNIDGVITMCEVSVDKKNHWTSKVVTVAIANEGSTIPADYIEFDKTGTGYQATTVQEALVELEERMKHVESTDIGFSLID